MIPAQETFQQTDKRRHFLKCETFDTVITKTQLNLYIYFCIFNPSNYFIILPS